MRISQIFVLAKSPCVKTFAQCHNCLAASMLPAGQLLIRLKCFSLKKKKLSNSNVFSWESHIIVAVIVFPPLQAQTLDMPSRSLDTSARRLPSTDITVYVCLSKIAKYSWIWLKSTLGYLTQHNVQITHHTSMPILIHMTDHSVPFPTIMVKVISSDAVASALRTQMGQSSFL